MMLMPVAPSISAAIGEAALARRSARRERPSASRPPRRRPSPRSTPSIRSRRPLRVGDRRAIEERDRSPTSSLHDHTFAATDGRDVVRRRALASARAIRPRSPTDPVVTTFMTLCMRRCTSWRSGGTRGTGAAEPGGPRMLHLAHRHPVSARRDRTGAVSPSRSAGGVEAVPDRVPGAVAGLLAGPRGIVGRQRPGDRRRPRERRVAEQDVRDAGALGAGQPGRDHGVGRGQDLVEHDRPAGEDDHDQPVDEPPHARDDRDVGGRQRQRRGVALHPRRTAVRRRPRCRSPALRAGREVATRVDRQPVPEPVGEGLGDGRARA